jgi:hypothetical protein
VPLNLGNVTEAYRATGYGRSNSGSATAVGHFTTEYRIPRGCARGRRAQGCADEPCSAAVCIDGLRVARIRLALPLGNERRFQPVTTWEVAPPADSRAHLFGASSRANSTRVRKSSRKGVS